ncbi:MAG: glycosyltransferase family 4 protein [Planctomycetaceae bacterium]|nr:glycosyltransferase family 4 protein [Planctomycetaceae bacterium]
MRIGLVIEHFDARRGGAEQWTCHLAQWLVAQGHDVHVVCQDASEDAPGAIHPLGTTSSRLAFAAAAEMQLRQLPLDVIHDMGVGWFADIIQSHDGSREAQWQRKLQMLPPWLRPLKRQLINWSPRYREFRSLATRQYNVPERLVIALSNSAAADYRHYHHVHPSRIRVVYHGVDAHRFSPENCAHHRASMRKSLGLSADEIVLLFAAHNFALKGLATLIRALAQLRNTTAGFRAVVAGGGHPAAFRRLASRCGLGTTVQFVGAIDDLLPYYAAADVYVQPTFYDSFGLTVLEAAACGLPVITTTAAGVSELLIDGHDGYVLPEPADDIALAARLRTLADPSRRRSIGTAARRLAERHTFEANCQQIAAIYREIANQRQG